MRIEIVPQMPAPIVLGELDAGRFMKEAPRRFFRKDIDSYYAHALVVPDNENSMHFSSVLIWVPSMGQKEQALNALFQP